MILSDAGTVVMPNYGMLMVGIANFKALPQVDQDHIIAHKVQELENIDKLDSLEEEGKLDEQDEKVTPEDGVDDEQPLDYGRQEKVELSYEDAEMESQEFFGTLIKIA